MFYRFESGWIGLDRVWLDCGPFVWRRGGAAGFGFAALPCCKIRYDVLSGWNRLWSGLIGFDRVWLDCGPFGLSFAALPYGVARFDSMFYRVGSSLNRVWSGLMGFYGILVIYGLGSGLVAFRSVLQDDPIRPLIGLQRVWLSFNRFLDPLDRLRQDGSIDVVEWLIPCTRLRRWTASIQRYCDSSSLKRFNLT